MSDFIHSIISGLVIHFGDVHCVKLNALAEIFHFLLFVLYDARIQWKVNILE